MIAEARPSVARIEALIAVWPKSTKEAASDIMEIHGPPDEANEGILVWNRPGRWSRVILHRDESAPEALPDAVLVLN